MFSLIVGRAYEIDQWLKAHVGRLYTTILASSLGMGIVASFGVVAHAFGANVSTKAGLVALGAAAVQAALLVNQLAQLHEYRQQARERRAARRERKAQKRASD